MIDAIEPARPIASRRAKGVVLPLRSLVALVLVGIGVAIAWMMGGDEPEATRTVINLPDQVATVDVSGAEGPVLQMPSDDAANPLERILQDPDAEPATPAVVSANGNEQTVPASGTAAPNELPEPIAMPEQMPVEAPEVVAAPESVAAPASQPQSQPQPQPESAAPTAPPTTASAPTAGGYHQAGWYRQRAASEYSLQLLGSRSRQAALDFMAAQSGVADLGYFETVHEGKPWFVVTQGAYAGRTQAQQGAAKLPESLRKLNPWPRSMGSIQQSLR